ncbi:MAG: rhamnogalacturonan acetylesterase [Melioribacteraceae bacterium]|nr:rhamnogalacturonan acetylesterase [Melioribacteraceae bacterium]
MKKTSYLFLIILSFLFFNFLIQEKPTIYLIGDSTCADKPLDDNPEHGWGQVFHNFFSDDIKIENHAKNGRSTKSFIDQGLWQVVLNKLKPGDYVFIQFGHNDSKISDTTRYAEANTTYRRNLIRYVEETKSKGAIPILLTPVNRRKFDDSGKFIDQHGDYPKVVREVANQLNVPLLDIHSKSLELFSKLGADKTKELFLIGVQKGVFKSLPDGKDDNTHFTRKGAIEIAKLVVESIREINLDLSKYLINELPFSEEGNGKVVALDYHFNKELKKDKDGKEIQFHYTWEDRENSGFYELGNLIENLGANLYEVKNAPNYEELSKLSIYIIVDPDTKKESENPNYIDEKSIDEIVKWVYDGGVLVLLANDFGNCEFEKLNKLSEKFGIHFNEISRNNVTGTDFHKGKFDKLPNHPIFLNVNSIYMKEISTLKLSANAKAILTDNNEVIIASSEYGKGFVFAVGDPWLYNEYFDNRKLPKEFENYKAAKNLFSWLLNKSKKVR